MESEVFIDERGNIFESCNKSKREELGFNLIFVQENQTYSNQNVIRGLHYQIGESAQGI